MEDKAMPKWMKKWLSGFRGSGTNKRHVQAQVVVRAIGYDDYLNIREQAGQHMQPGETLRRCNWLIEQLQDDDTLWQFLCHDPLFGNVPYPFQIQHNGYTVEWIWDGENQRYERRTIR